MSFSPNYWKFFTNFVSSSSIDLCPEEGGGSAELVPGGRDMQVTDANVYDYVRKYSEYRMIKTQEKSLEVSVLKFFFSGF